MFLQVSAVFTLLSVDFVLNTQLAQSVHAFNAVNDERTEVKSIEFWIFYVAELLGFFSSVEVMAHLDDMT